MARRRKLTEGKKNIIAGLIEEYDIKTANDIQEALKDLLGGTIQEMLEAELNELLGYESYERSDKGPRKKMCKQYLTNLDKAKITGISLTRLVNNTIGFYLSTGYGYAEERPERS